MLHLLIVRRFWRCKIRLEISLIILESWLLHRHSGDSWYFALFCKLGILLHCSWAHYLLLLWCCSQKALAWSSIIAGTSALDFLNILNLLKSGICNVIFSGGISVTHLATVGIDLGSFGRKVALRVIIWADTLEFESSRSSTAWLDVLHRHGHVTFGLGFCISWFWHTAVATDQEFIIFPFDQLLWHGFIWIIVGIYILNLLNIGLNTLKILVDKLLVLMQKCSLLNISENQSGNLLKVELGVTREREHLVGIFVVHYDENLRTAVLDYLLGFPEEASFLHIELFILFRHGILVCFHGFRWVDGLGWVTGHFR